MDISDTHLIVSPSDLVNYLYCPHLTKLSLDYVRGEIDKPNPEKTERPSVAQRRGVEHETNYLETIRSSQSSLICIDSSIPRNERVSQTINALNAGVDVIYQAAFYSCDSPRPAWVGYADFLRRVEIPSGLGPYSYEPEDTKLARHVRPSAVLQLCEYSEALSRIQGKDPEYIHVILGGQERVSLRLAEFAAYFRITKARFEKALASKISAYPNPVEHCGVCTWRLSCDEKRKKDDHLSLVPGLSSEQARKLRDQCGIDTVEQLANLPSGTQIAISTKTFEKLRRQAKLLVAARKSPGGLPYELLKIDDPSLGLGSLPEPDPGDLFFDIEGDPYVGDGGLEYLLGVGWVGADGNFDYKAFWCHDSVGEKSSFEAFIDLVVERRKKNPNLHIYHYAPYEPSALGRLMGRHGTREQEVDDLLRDGVLVDLYRIVRQALCIGVTSYSLKKLEAFYMTARSDAITDAGSSIDEYERWIQESDESILEELEKYNRVDCESTLGLRNWLEDRRSDYEMMFGIELSRPMRMTQNVNATEPLVIPEAQELRDSLFELNTHEDSSSKVGAHLLGDLLEWHRREDKPKWWKYFERVLYFESDDFFQDPEAIAGLTYQGVIRQEKESLVHRYMFGPEQEHKLALGSRPLDPASTRQKLETNSGPPNPGSIEYLDSIKGIIDLKRGKNSLAPHPEHLIPEEPIGTSHQRQALVRVAKSVLESRMVGEGKYQAIRDLLLCRPPRLKKGRSGASLVKAGEDVSEAAIRIARELNGGCLAIQGPPGSGKTRTAAQIIVSLVDKGHSVGITANSHAVITNLLEKVMEQALEKSVDVKVSQKISDRTNFDKLLSNVTLRKTPKEMADDLSQGTKVLAGTSWLFSRPEFDQSLDYLIVDEAGQLSLANVCALGTAAKNLVLVGDPRQLSQPSQGTHPSGAGASALEHLLNGSPTIAPDKGIFLDCTHRLHPEICKFISEIVYEGRLQSYPGCEKQVIDGSGLLHGSGLRWVPVEHKDNRSSSIEEADQIKLLVDDLLGYSWSDNNGDKRALELSDILIVAPYNAQVSLLASKLGDGARVGTVDRFQGQQAPVVIVSMTSSSSEQVPRSMEFLYSQERLNVAVSRAQAMSIIVGSPGLLSVECRTVGQMRLANGLCRFVEIAS